MMNKLHCSFERAAFIKKNRGVPMSVFKELPRGKNNMSSFVQRWSQKHSGILDEDESVELKSFISSSRFDSLVITGNRLV